MKAIRPAICLRTNDFRRQAPTPARSSVAEILSKELEALKERAIRSGFWGEDFNWQPGQPLHHDWQDYRTRKDPSLKLEVDA